MFKNHQVKRMISSYLGEYALSYNPTRHGKPGLGASKGSAKAWIIKLNK